MQHGIGIVGTGMIAEHFMRALEAIGNANLVACLSRTEERAREIGRTWGCQGYASIESFLAHPGLETVIVCTPSGDHLEPALRAIEAGKHVIVEKPLEITPERCDRMIARAREKNVHLAGVFQSRFGPGARRVKEAIQQGRLGKITIAHASVKWYRTQEYYDQAGWRGTWALDGGGALMNQSIHAVDLLHWLAGEVAEVSAYTATLAHTGIEVEDTAVAVLRFTSGALGTIMGTTAAWPGWSKRLEISGTTGSIALEDDRIVRWDLAETTPEDEEILQQISDAVAPGAGAADPASIDHEGHRSQIVDFLEALEGNHPPFVDGGEARKAVAIIDAIYRSARTGKPEKVQP